MIGLGFPYGGFPPRDQPHPRPWSCCWCSRRLDWGAPPLIQLGPVPSPWSRPNKFLRRP